MLGGWAVFERVDQRVDQIERRIDGITYEIYGVGSRLEYLDKELSRSPAAAGWRSIRRDIANLRWRFVVLPRVTRTAAGVLNAVVSVGALVMVLL